MKTQHVLRAFGIMAVLFLCLGTANAAPGSGSVMGQVTDPGNDNKPVDGATVILDCKGNQFTYYTNEKGYYYASNIPAGTYTVTIMFMSETKNAGEIRVGSDDTQVLDVAMGTVKEMDVIEVNGGRAAKKLIDPLNPTSTVLLADDMKKATIIKLEDVTTMLNIPEFEGNYYVRGARDGGLSWYVDGCKIMGNPNVPVSGVEEVRSYVGFIPAKYGDTLGGVIAVETRNWFNQ